MQPTELNGRVLWSSTSSRVRDAHIAVSKIDSGDKKHVVADEDGHFKVELEDGEWTVTVLHADGRQIGPKTIKVPDDIEKLQGAKMEFRVSSLTRSVSQAAGTSFFVALIVLLLATIAGWVWTHMAFPDPRPPSIASNLLNLTAEARLLLADSEGPTGNAKLAMAVTAIERQLGSGGGAGKETDTAKRLRDKVAEMKLLLVAPSELALRELTKLSSDLKSSGSANTRAVADALSVAQKAIEDGAKLHESMGLRKLIEALRALGSDQFEPRAKYLVKLDDLVANSKNSEDQRRAALICVLEEMDQELPALAQAEVKAAAGGSSA